MGFVQREGFRGGLASDIVAGGMGSCVGKAFLVLIVMLLAFRCCPGLPASACVRSNRTQHQGACPEATKRGGLPPGAAEVHFSSPTPVLTSVPADRSSINPYLHIKGFLRFVQPRPLPVELLQDYVNGDASVADIITKVLEMEAGFLTLLLFAVVLSLVVPVMTLGLCSPRPVPPPSCAPNCKRRTLVFILHLVLVFLLLGGGGMLWTNDECSRGVGEAGQALRRVVTDAAGLWSGVLLQLQHLLTVSFEEVLFPLSQDINNAETLLGRPIQVELVLETGLDSALENLKIIAAGAKEVCSQTAVLLAECGEAESAAVSARTALGELTAQLDRVQHHCGVPDRPLCDSVIFQNPAVRFSAETITNSTELKYLKQGVVDSLANSIIETNAVFTSLPEEVSKQTKFIRQSILELLNERRGSLRTAAMAFNSAKRNVQSDLGLIKDKVGPTLESIQYLDYWRWLTGLVAGISVLYIWALLTGATCCGCCGGEKSSSPTLIVTVILIGLVSFFLWLLMMAAFLIGGHGEVFVCRALEEDPDLYTFSNILDTRGLLIQTQGSYISSLLLGNGNITMPLASIVQNCRKNGSAYGALNLKHLLDVGSVTNVTSWRDIAEELQGIRFNLRQMQVLTPSLQARMTDLLHGLNINITRHRAKLSGPVSNDLEAFANQLNSVASRIHDLSTATHLDTLATKSRRLLATYIKDLQHHKENLVYQLTSLELKINPLQRQVNQSLSHLKAVQYYITTHGDTMSQAAVNVYIERILNYLEQYQKHVQKNLRSIPCKSISDLYSFMNLAICRHIIDPLNGFWFCTFWCLIIFLIQTPICLKLVDYYCQAAEDCDVSTSQSFVNGNDNGEWDPENRDRTGW